MRMRIRREWEPWEDSEAGLAVCDLLAQSNVEPGAVSREFLEELLATEYQRRQQLSPAQTRKPPLPMIISLGCSPRPR
ncbi:MAG: hypothetical protein RL215_2057 [Planctomycetota bacterium]